MYVVDINLCSGDIKLNNNISQLHQYISTVLNGTRVTIKDYCIIFDTTEGLWDITTQEEFLTKLFKEIIRLDIMSRNRVKKCLNEKCVYITEIAEEDFSDYDADTIMKNL